MTTTFPPSVSGPSAGPRNRRVPFLRALVRRGAEVIASIPRELPEQIVDPTPSPGWRRMLVISSIGAEEGPEPLVVRACRYVALLPLVFRIFALPAVLLMTLGALGGTDLALLCGGVLVAVALNVYGAVWVLRACGVRRRPVEALMAVDGCVAVLLNLVLCSTITRAEDFGAVAMIGWTYLAGSVVLWTLCRGVPSAAGLALIGVPLQLGMVAVAPAEVSVHPADIAGHTLLLAAAIVTGVGLLALLGLSSRLCLGLGMARATETAQANTNRLIHDTVLQSLEAMALPVPTDMMPAEQQLAELRMAARVQAMELRHRLDNPHGTGGGLVEQLRALAVEMAREGVRAELVLDDIDDETLPTLRRNALRDATREVLRNTKKHAGTTCAVVRVEEQEDGIAVIARDQGIGFDPAVQQPGFGITDSIGARLTQVGGRASVNSRPGRGTRVTLWVPR